MGRTANEGLDYFPVDIEIFDDPKILIAQDIVDPDGTQPFSRYSTPYMAIRLLREIYKKGCILEWSDDICRAHAGKISNGMTTPILAKIIAALVASGFFNSEKLTEYKILTSHGIQKKWLLIMTLCRRRVKPISKEYNLLPEGYPQFKKSRKKAEKIVATTKPIVVATIDDNCTTKPIVATMLLQDKRLSFSIINNKSIDNKGVITIEEYNRSIKEYINKEKEREIVATTKPIVVATIDDNCTTKPIVVATIDDNCTTKPIVVAISKVELTEVDFQLLSQHGEDFRLAWQDWVTYRFYEHNKIYSSVPAKAAAIRNLLQTADWSEDMAIKIIRKSIANTWRTFNKLESDDLHTFKKGSKTKSSTEDIDEQIKNETDPEKRRLLQEKKYEYIPGKK